MRDTVRQQLGQAAATPQNGAAVQPARQPTPAVPALDIAGAVAALPAGEFTVTEAQANAYIAPKLPSLKPVDRLTVRFVPGEVQLQIGAYGLSSTAHIGLAVQQGKVLAVNPQLDGPLAGLIDLNDFIGPVQQAINDQLGAQGRSVRSITIGNGVITAEMEQ